jgi:hypothetical protein
VFEMAGDLVKYCRDNHWRTNPAVLEGRRIAVFPKLQHGDSFRSREGIIINPYSRREYSTVRFVQSQSKNKGQLVDESALLEGNAREPFLVGYDGGSHWEEPDNVSTKMLSAVVNHSVIRRFWKMVKMIVETKAMVKPFLVLLRDIIRPDENISTCGGDSFFPQRSQSTNEDLQQMLILLSRPEYKIFWIRDAESHFRL